MKSMSFGLAIAACTILAATSAEAQTCMGRPYFSTGPMQLGIAGGVGNHSSSVTGELAAGRDRSLFGAAKAGYESGERRGTTNEPSGATFGGTVGYQISLHSKSSAQLCPFVSGEWANLGYRGGTDLDRQLFQAGATVGWEIPSSSSFHVVPFAGVAFAQLGRTFTDVGGSKSDIGTDTYTPVMLGVGFHFQNAVMLVSQLTIPVDLGGGDPSLGLGMVLPIGRSRK